MLLPRPYHAVGTVNLYERRHMNDNMPFALWQDEKQAYRSLTTTAIRCIMEVFHVEGISCYACYITIATDNLPQPVPLATGLTTTCHHESIPFFDLVRSRAQEGLLGPRKYLPGRL
jgi:hypothetical protein